MSSGKEGLKSPIDHGSVVDMLQNFDKVGASAHGPRAGVGMSASGDYTLSNHPKAEFYAGATTGRAEGN